MLVVSRLDTLAHDDLPDERPSHTERLRDRRHRLVPGRVPARDRLFLLNRELWLSSSSHETKMTIFFIHVNQKHNVVPQKVDKFFWSVPA